MVFSYLKINKNSQSYRCLNIAKNRVFGTFRLGLLETGRYGAILRPDSVSTPKITSKMTIGISITITTSYFVDLCN